jgi:hypothetical protein
MYRRFVVFLGVVVLLGVLTACGSPRASASTAATVTATGTPVPTSATVAFEPVSTSTSVPPTATATGGTTSDIPVCRTLQNLNLRPGPGLSFDPAIRLLPPDATLVPLAFSAIGFPDGQWVQVRDDATGNEGWVSAATQFLSCNFDVTTLPQAASIPPTPTLLPTPTVQPTATSAPAVAGAAPRISNSAPGGTSAPYAEGEVIVNDYFLFRMRILDTRAGSEDGAGIDHVEFFVSTQSGDQIYSRRENNAAYCTFGGGEPNCNNWPQRDGRYVWGEGGPEVEPGTYFASILVTPKNQAFEGETWNWNFSFDVSLP